MFLYARASYFGRVPLVPLGLSAKIVEDIGLRFGKQQHGSHLTQRPYC